MFTPDQYQLLDFGSGRKLERWGKHILDRGSPPAEEDECELHDEWETADSVYRRKQGTTGRWSKKLEPWIIEHAAGETATVRMELRPTEFGHIGVFPEQASNWDWIAARLKRAKQKLKVLNLFAYTGGSTLAAAAAGAEVTHVDSSKSVVQWARANAALSNLSEAPIRWIIEDAAKFVRREVKRGNEYDAVILDPPSYGHGPKGETWKLSQQLGPLLQDLAKLTSGRLQFVVLTCHSPGFGPAELLAHASDAFFQSCQAGGERELPKMLNSVARRGEGT